MTYLRVSLAALFFALATVASGQETTDLTPAMPPVEDFVRSPGFHGFSYEAASLYGADDVAPLVRMLRDPAEMRYWSGAVWVLGVIGTDDAVGALIDFLETGATGTASPGALQALLLVPQALGFAAEDPDSRAFAWLRESLYVKPGERQMAWTGPGWEPGTREVLIAKLAANGLGLAGNEAGRRVLAEARERMSRDDPERLRFLSPNITEATALSRRISEMGRPDALRRGEIPPGRGPIRK